MPATKLDMASFSAKPNANPVNPNPATNAETSKPNSDRAKTTPIKIKMAFCELANSRNTSDDDVSK